jgi:hypothetical protein
MVPFDAVFLAMPIVPGIADNVLRHADDVGDARRVVVELGSGNLANLPKIVAENPGARVIGTELPEVERWLEVARRHPGVYSDFDELLENYKAATAAGAEIKFLDYKSLPANFADKTISIAPYPGRLGVGGELASAVETAQVMANITKPGGRIYVAADTIFTATDMAGELSHKLGVSVVPTQLVPVPYVSQYLRYRRDTYWAHIIDVAVP